jgi:hypothetical protein
VESLEIKNRLPKPSLSQEDLEQLVRIGQEEDNSGLVLDQMVRGNFSLQEQHGEQFFG